MSVLVLNVLLGLIALAFVYAMGVVAVRWTFSKIGGVDKRKMLVLAAIVPVATYVPITLAHNGLLDGQGVAISYAVLFVLAIQIIKSVSSAENYTYKNAFVLFISIFWRFFAIAMVIGALLRLVIYSVKFAAS